jgi:DNA-binding XRE family transcriptional regulator
MPSDRSGRRSPVLSCLYSAAEYYPSFAKDLQSARSLVLIQTPFLAERAIRRWLPALAALLAQGVRVCVFVQQPKTWHKRHSHNLANDRAKELDTLAANIKLLEVNGVHVSLRPGIHAKVAIIDDEILWEGSLNILSHNDTQESMRRWTCRVQVARSLAKNELFNCNTCSIQPGFSLFANHNFSIADRVKFMWCRIVDKRKLLGLSQTELAKRSGVIQSTISECISGKRKIMLEAFVAICHALDLELIVVPRYLVPAIEDLLHHEPVRE